MQVELDVAATMRDGTILRADVYRPLQGGPWPVLLQRTPYDKRQAGNWLVIDPLQATLRGYMIVHQDTRGRFTSDGEWLPWAFEREDGYDTVEWAARLPGSSGRVGMIGGSYTGSTQFSAALMRAPSLLAIAPEQTWSDPEDGLFFRGGAIEIGLNTAWGLGMALGQLAKTGAPDAGARTAAALESLDHLADRTYWELPSGAMPSLVGTGQPDIGVARALADERTTGESRISDRYDEIDVPSLNVAGWYDVFQQGSLDNFVALRERGVPARLVVGPWSHGSQYLLQGANTVGDVNFGIASAMPAENPTQTELQLGWFDHWLREGAESDASRSGVKIFVMGINRWRDEEEWPLARAVATPLHLRAEARLDLRAPDASEGGASFVYDPSDPAITRGGNLVMASEFPPGPFDQSAVEDRDDVLVFTGEPLQQDLEVTGRVRAVLFAETDAPSTDWVVRLCDVDPAGRSWNVVDGIVRVASTPGAVMRHEIDLWSTSIVFRAGHRIRVHVTSSNFPRWDRNLNTGESPLHGTTSRPAQQRVLHDAEHPSHLVLPVVPR